MELGRADLADLTYFLTIAKHRSFRQAALELGVSTSALSHALKGLEARRGVRLLNRTTRSVTLTAAGEELQTAIGAPFDTIGEALENLNRYRDAPAGRIRINALEHSAMLLMARVLPTFVERYPEIEIDLSVSNSLMDITERGFDAGVRYGGTVPEDMIAQRLSADIRWVVVGSPAYLDQRGVPTHPTDLHQHRCLKIRLGDDRIYHWEFDKDGEVINLDVPGVITLDNTQLGLALVAGGAGLMYVPEPCAAPQIETGEIRTVLDDWLSDGPGLYIYYSGRRQVPTGLRLLIELVREIHPLQL